MKTLLIKEAQLNYLTEDGTYYIFLFLPSINLNANIEERVTKEKGISPYLISNPQKDHLMSRRKRKCYY